MRYVNRDIEPILIEAVRQFRVLVLTGSRQTGKSTILKKCFAKTHQYITLDDPAQAALAQNDPQSFLKSIQKPVIIDEIQYAPHLTRFIKMEVDKNSKPGQFILSGSQRFSLMNHLQESLAGRAGIYELFPMSILEGPSKKSSYAYRALHGSYPEILLSSHVKDVNQWYGGYLATYIDRDVQPHYQLEKIAYFRDMLFLLGARCGQVLNYQSLATELGVTITAIKSWIKILEASQLIYILRPYYRNLGARLIKSPKVYFTDIGLVTYLTAQKHSSALKNGPLAGALWENFVISEIVKFFNNRGQSPRLFFYRDNQGLEVDLLIEFNTNTLIPCEIKLTRTPHLTAGKSIAKLAKVLEKKSVQLKQCYVIAPLDASVKLSKNITAVSLDALFKAIK